MAMKKILLVSIGFGFFLALITGSRVTSLSGVDPGFSTSIALGMAATGCTCILVGAASIKHIALFRKGVFLAYLMLCAGSFALSLLGIQGMAASVAMGVGLGCGYLTWGDVLGRCTKRQIMVIPLLMSALWGMVGSLVTLVDDYASRMVPMLFILAVSGAAYLCLPRCDHVRHPQEDRPRRQGGTALLPAARAVLPTLWKPTLLVGILGFSSGILRVLTAASGADPLVLSAVRFSCAIVVVLLFLLWSRRSAALETSPITLVLLLVAASAFMLLPLAGPRYQVALASVVDTVYLLSGIFLFMSCALTALNEESTSMLTCGFGQGVSILFIAAGFSMSTYLAHHALDRSFSAWVLALVAIYWIMIIVVVFSMPWMKERKLRQPHSIRMVLTVSEDAVRNNNALIETYRISKREMDVLVLALTGRNAAAIAEMLFLSESTVRTHLKHIYKKLDIHSKEELHRLVEGLLAEESAHRSEHGAAE